MRDRPATGDRCAEKPMFRVLYVDNCVGRQQSIKQSFDTDRALTVLTCTHEADPIEIASRWEPDLLLCDAAGANPDAFALLSRWQNAQSTTAVPVVLTVDQDQTTQFFPFSDSGLVRVLVAPVDPSTLLEVARDEIRTSQMKQLRSRFSQRLVAEEAELKRYCEVLRDASASGRALEELWSRAHQLAGAAGIYGFEDVSRAASQLQMTISPKDSTVRSPVDVSESLDNLLMCIAGAKSRCPATSTAHHARQF